ncbi:MAG: RDD family protein [Chloroflexi bacterium]|nr:RDD family protein [Chloroflexota bacterium]
MAIEGGSGAGPGEFQTVNVPPPPAPGTTFQAPPPPMVQTSVGAGQKAGFWIRFGAYIIDAVLLLIIAGVLGRVLPSLANLLGVGVGLIYFVSLWTNGGQTIGFKLLHLRVVKTDGSALSVGDAIIRYIGLVISFVVVGLGVMWVGWDANKQGWHDRMASTYVLKV